MTSTWDNKTKRQLIDRIDQTFETDAEYRQLLRIIQENNIKFTENKNGCFIDLTKIDDIKVLNKLVNVVDLCEESRKYLEESNQAYIDAIQKN